MVTDPLADVRVLRIGDRLAGRTLTRLLTDQGARATVVDLDDPDARAKAIAACAGCDIVVDAGAIGRADAAGLGFDDLAPVRPGLIYCSLPVFPPAPADVAPGAGGASAGRVSAGTVSAGTVSAGTVSAGTVSAGTVSAGTVSAGGVPVDDDIAIAAELGLNFVAGREPRDEELPVGSSFGAFLAAGYVMAALLRVRRDPSGQRIVVPLAAATLTTVARRLIRAADPALVDPVAGPRLPIASRYACSDGCFVQSGGAYSRFVETFVDVIGRPEWRPEAVQALLGLPTAADEAAWRGRLDAVFLERTADEWERAINDAGGSCTRCRTRAEWLAEPHARESGIVVDDGTSIRAGRAVRVFEAAPDGGSPAPRDGGAAQRGDGVAQRGDGVAQRGDTVAEHGDGVAVARNGGGLGDSGSPLRGVVVVDLSIVLAGPTCGRALGDLGADVIKVDDPHRPISPYGWLEVNRGKRSILVDLRRDEGREVLWRMLSGADVLLENYRHGKLDQLGFGFADVARACPGIVYASLNAFDVGGPWAARPGWEHNAQAATGMQLALGGWGPGRPPDQVTYPLNDFGTGLLGAYGILLALRRRDATGAAQFVAGSLARTATFISSPLFEEQAADRAASSVRWLRCPDGYVGVLHSVSGRAASEGGALDGDLIRDAADVAGRAASREEAAERLRASGFGCVVVRGSAELPDRPWVRDSGLVVEWEHPRWGALRQSRARGWATGFEPSPSYPAHDPGQDTSVLLAEHGYDDVDIRRLVESGAVASVPLFEMWSVA
ncbi:CoA transferase [Rugosimonospora africana]|nr:CoA transferase [Rugosimonospora africana]